MNRRRALAFAAAGWLACAPAGAQEVREVFPGVRVGPGVVEFDGEAPIDAHAERGVFVFLELVACSPDTREHESLVMTRAKASDIHAALLMAGFREGRPGAWRTVDGEIERVEPEGDAVAIEFCYDDGAGGTKSVSVADWVKDVNTGARLGGKGGGGFVFAGTRFVTRSGREVYDADGAGTVIGLCTFGSEVVAWREVISPEAAVEEPRWVADPERYPAAGTKIMVRLTRPEAP